MCSCLECAVRTTHTALLGPDLRARQPEAAVLDGARRHRADGPPAPATPQRSG